jgi:hypothetical protein
MKQKKKASPPGKALQTRAEHLRQYKGVSLPARLEGKHAGAAITPRPGGRTE